ncbi:MAG: MarR family transcriptional regulator [Methanobrevibacter sp.]|nr:MarR family transcriptional regulator [Methanobrevibacter sp.]
MKLTDKSSEVFEYVKGNGGHVSVEEICSATGRAARSINANINDLVKKGLAEREKVEMEGEDKPVTYVNITEAGKSFVPSDED